MGSIKTPVTFNAKISELLDADGKVVAVLHSSDFDLPTQDDHIAEIVAAVNGRAGLVEAARAGQEFNRLMAGNLVSPKHDPAVIYAWSKWVQLTNAALAASTPTQGGEG